MFGNAEVQRTCVLNYTDYFVRLRERTLFRGCFYPQEENMRTNLLWFTSVEVWRSETEVKLCLLVLNRTKDIMWVWEETETWQQQQESPGPSCSMLVVLLSVTGLYKHNSTLHWSYTVLLLCCGYTLTPKWPTVREMNRKNWDFSCLNDPCLAEWQQGETIYLPLLCFGLVLWVNRAVSSHSLSQTLNWCCCEITRRLSVAPGCSRSPFKRG